MKATTLADARTLKGIIGEDWREYLEEVYARETDICGRAEHRLIKASEIDKIMQDELASDEYVLGCCSAWFVADMLDIPVDAVEKMQKAEAFEGIGALLARNIEEVQEAMALGDGYGHHFNRWDGSEYEITLNREAWYLFPYNC